MRDYPFVLKDLEKMGGGYPPGEKQILRLALTSYLGSRSLRMTILVVRAVAPA